MDVRICTATSVLKHGPKIAKTPVRSAKSLSSKSREKTQMVMKLWRSCLILNKGNQTSTTSDARPAKCKYWRVISYLEMKT